MFSSSEDMISVSVVGVLSGGSRAFTGFQGRVCDRYNDQGGDGEEEEGKELAL